MKNKETKEKVCCFFASDYHFEMIALPYINTNMDNKKNVKIFSQNDLEKTVNTLVSKINLKDDRKEDILNLDWSKKDNLDSVETIDENSVVFIKGEEDYINRVNQKLKENNLDNIKVINCYEIDEVKDHVDNIMEKYDRILNTEGEKQI